MMTTITLPPIDADFPSITIRAARFRLDGSWDGAVAIVLTTGGASVSLDTRRLSPYEARAIGMATGRTLLLRGQGEPIAAAGMADAIS